MFSYKDMTFCQSDCINKECHRNKEHLKHNTENWPVCFADFSGDCDEYIAPENKKEKRNILK